MEIREEGDGREWGRETEGRGEINGEVRRERMWKRDRRKRRNKMEKREEGEDRENVEERQKGEAR